MMHYPTISCKEHGFSPLPIADCQLPIGARRNKSLELSKFDVIIDCQETNRQLAIGNWQWRKRLLQNLALDGIASYTAPLQSQREVLPFAEQTHSPD
jgi:hypothetical protein